MNTYNLHMGGKVWDTCQAESQDAAFLIFAESSEVLNRSCGADFKVVEVNGTTKAAKNLTPLK